MDIYTQDQFEDWRFGFPVLLTNVPMVKARGDAAPNINANDFRDAVLWLLAHSPHSLTGRQVRYVRLWMQKTLREFAEVVGMTSHQSVMKWEAKAHESTGMHKSTEILLRCRILESLPLEVWERFKADEPCRLGFVHRLEGVSNFDRNAEPTLIEIDVDPYIRADFGHAGGRL